MSDYREPPVDPMDDAITLPELAGYSARAISIRTAEDGRIGLYVARDLWARICSVMVSQAIDEDVRRLGEQMAEDRDFVRRD